MSHALGVIHFKNLSSLKYTFMLQYQSAKPKQLFFFLLLMIVGISAQSQTTQRVQPKWWFGLSGAANINKYLGTTQSLTPYLSVPTAFHKGDGIKPYGSFLIEYRPKKVWGGMLNLAYDNRGGKFDQVIAPCNCPADLSTNLSYLSIEPSIRIAPFANAFYIFAGPTIGVNISKSFTYQQLKQTDVRDDWSNVRKTMIEVQAGLGVDIPVSNKSSETQMTLSPFASFQTDLLQTPRSIESWNIYTIRAGVALKFGTGKKLAVPVAPPAPTSPDPIIIITPAPEREVIFSVRAPKIVPLQRQVKETFPIRNYVFFDMGSSEIPNRYVLLNQSQATSFKEEQLQESQPENLNTGRSARQMAVYHNILNITGDRLRANPQSTITLVGASDKNPVEGKLMAENIKSYLVKIYGIDGARIITEGRDKPMIPSEQPGGTKELVLLREGDRRVDIESNSPELLLQVGGSTSPFLRPVQIRNVQRDPLDSHVIFYVEGANDLLEGWSVAITDEHGTVQHYGSFTSERASVSGRVILGDNTQGNYKIIMTGKTKTGKTITKESSVSLMKMDDPKQEGLRYSILFDFDKSKTIESYEKFLADVVAPLVPENGTVIIHGHTDIIGEEAYNLKLSQGRAADAQRILSKALNNAGKKGVKFETYGFGKDTNIAPFENNLPEERFYNRAVIIDIIPNK